MSRNIPESDIFFHMLDMRRHQDLSIAHDILVEVAQKKNFIKISRYFLQVEFFSSG